MDSIIYLFKSDPVIFSVISGLTAAVMLLLIMIWVRSGKNRKQLKNLEQFLRKNIGKNSDDSLKVIDKIFKSIQAQNNKNYALIEAAFKETSVLKKLITDLYRSVEKQFNDVKMESASRIDGLVGKINSGGDGFSQMEEYFKEILVLVHNVSGEINRQFSETSSVIMRNHENIALNMESWSKKNLQDQLEQIESIKEALNMSSPEVSAGPHVGAGSMDIDGISGIASQLEEPQSQLIKDMQSDIKALRDSMHNAIKAIEGDIKILSLESSRNDDKIIGMIEKWDSAFNISMDKRFRELQDKIDEVGNTSGMEGIDSLKEILKAMHNIIQGMNDNIVDLISTFRNTAGR